MKNYFLIIPLFLFSNCSGNKQDSSNIQSTSAIQKDTTAHYNKIINDTAFYIGINYYHISPHNIDSICMDTILVIKTNTDSIIIFTKDSYIDYVDNRWHLSKLRSAFIINNKHSYKFDGTDKESIYVTDFNFYNDSLSYEHKRSINSVTETYKFKGKRISPNK